MNEYILELIKCGYSPHEAYMTYYSFMKEYSMDDLILLIDSMEKDRYEKCG